MNPNRKSNKQYTDSCTELEVCAQEKKNTRERILVMAENQSSVLKPESWKEDPMYIAKPLWVSQIPFKKSIIIQKKKSSQS